MEQRRTAGRTERQIARLVKYHEVGTHRPVCVLPLFAGYLVPFQRVDALGATSARGVAKHLAQLANTDTVSDMAGGVFSALMISDMILVMRCAPTPLRPMAIGFDPAASLVHIWANDADDAPAGVLRFPRRRQVQLLLDRIARKVRASGDLANQQFLAGRYPPDLGQHDHCGHWLRLCATFSAPPSIGQLVLRRSNADKIRRSKWFSVVRSQTCLPSNSRLGTVAA